MRPLASDPQDPLQICCALPLSHSYLPKVQPAKSSIPIRKVKKVTSIVTAEVAEMANLPLLQQGIALRQEQPTADRVAMAVMPLAVSDATD